MTMDPVAARLASEWGFTPTEELPGGHCSRVYANETMVLKVPFQGEELDSGCEMMSYLGAVGCTPRIFSISSGGGAILMERANPGLKLHEMDLSEEEQLKVWASLVESIRRLDKGFWDEKEQTTFSPSVLPLRSFVNMKDRLANHLIAWHNDADSRFLHGDLHHENILRHGEKWVLIDAKGLRGDRAFEGAAYVRNPIPAIGEATLDQMEWRVRRVAEVLAVDSFRVWGWTIVTLREGSSEPNSPWYKVLENLYAIASRFDGERFVEPLA